MVVQLQWFLSLGDHFIVALEDASLIQMNTIVSGTTITVQGRRKEVLNPVKVKLYRAECCPLVAIVNVATDALFVFDAGLGESRRITGIEASQWPICLQYGSHMSDRYITRANKLQLGVILEDHHILVLVPQVNSM